MDQVEEIRRLDRGGVSRSQIAARTGVSRPTVRKYAGREDFSPPVPVAVVRASILDRFKPVIDEILREDKKVWRKQRHTAKRVWERLRDEYGYEGAYSLVQRYVKAWRERDRVEHEAGGYNVLLWEPGSAQVDFGEADFDEPSGRVRKSYLVVSFPYSNQGFAQVFGGESAECVCRGLMDVFSAAGGVPGVLVFDNTTAAGRRLGGQVRESELFRRFRLHYGFETRFCNPYAGHEKGNVENKVGALRRDWFVPVPRLDDVEVFNEALLVGALDPDKVHYEKGVPVVDLFDDDRRACSPLPARVFDPVRWAEYTTDKYGRVTVDGVHTYSVAPQAQQSRVLVGFRAHRVDIVDREGRPLASHRRSFGTVRSHSVDHTAMMSALVHKPGAWRESVLRRELAGRAGRDFLDGLDRPALSLFLACVRDQAKIHGLNQAADALDYLAGRGRAFTPADLAVVSSRVDGFGLDRAPDPGPDLASYDECLGLGTPTAGPRP